MSRVLAAVIFLFAAVILLWKPLFLDKAPLPGQYLQKMEPWSSTQLNNTSQLQWNPLSWDAIAQFYPWRVFLGRSLQDGIIPLWNPHQFCGNPFLANGQSAVLYLPNWLFAAIGPIWAFILLAIFHLSVAGFFTYLLLKDLGVSDEGAMIAGLSFELCAFMTLWLELPTLLMVAAWLPCVLWTVYRAIIRRSYIWAVLSAVALSSAIFAGHLQIAFYVWFAAALWALYLTGHSWRLNNKLPTNQIRVLLFTFTFGVILSAAQILPSIEFSKLSHRQTETSWEGYQHFISSGLPLNRLVTAVIPDYFGNPDNGNYFLLGPVDDRFGMPADYIEYGLYSGLLTLAAAFVGLFSWRRNLYISFWTVLGALSILTAAGTWINLPMYFGIPGFAALGGPHRILLLYMFSVSMLAGFGVDHLCFVSTTKLPLFERKIKLGVALALAAISALGVFSVVSMSSADNALTQLPLQLRNIIPAVQSEAVLRYGVLMSVVAVLLILGGSGIISKRIFGILAALLVAIDLLGWGNGTLPVCNRSEVYPNTALTNYLKDNRDRRILPSNKEWSLTSVPASILPPNAAMVYGFYDAQGYDSLYTKVYKDYMTTELGIDPCPPENGNMILGKSITKSALGLSVSRNETAPQGNTLYNSDGIVIVDTGADSGWISRWDDKSLLTRFETPNSITVQLPDIASGMAQIRVLNYPGWRELGTDKKVKSDGTWMNCSTAGKRVINLVFQPDSFQIGIFLSLIGLSVCVGILTRKK